MQENAYSLFPSHGVYFRANDCSIEILGGGIEWIIFFWSIYKLGALLLSSGGLGSLVSFPR